MPTDGHSGFLKTGGSHIGAGRTAVRTAPIVCPEEIPLVCPQAHNLHWYADSPKGVQGGNRGKRVSSGYNRRRRLAPRSSGKQQAERTAVRAAPIVCPEESHPACIIGNNVAVSNSPWRGLTRRLRRGKRTCSPMGTLLFQVAIRRGAEGNAGKRVPSGHNRRRRLATRSSGKQQAERTAVRAAPIVCPEESPLLAPQSDSLVGD